MAALVLRHPPPAPAPDGAGGTHWVAILTTAIAVLGVVTAAIGRRYLRRGNASVEATLHAAKFGAYLLVVKVSIKSTGFFALRICKAGADKPWVSVWTDPNPKDVFVAESEALKNDNLLAGGEGSSDTVIFNVPALMNEELGWWVDFRFSVERYSRPVRTMIVSPPVRWMIKLIRLQIDPLWTWVAITFVPAPQPGQSLPVTSGS